MTYKSLLIVTTKILFALYCEIYSQQGWFPLNKINSDIILNSVSFLNDSCGFAVTNKGSILKSTDFGKSWSVLKLTETSLNDIFTVNGTCFIVGDNGKIFKTIDGIIWNELISKTNESLNSVYFTDVNDGYAFGSASTILKTTDEGESWIKLNVPDSLDIIDGVFPTADFGFCIVSDNALIRTLDYGNSWQLLSLPFSPVTSVCFLNENTGIITAYDYDVAVLLKTTDRGNSFEYIYPSTLNHLSSINFINNDVGFIAGERGYISKTTDGGINWKEIFAESNKDLLSIYFIDSLNGYAVGKDSTILKTTNAGKSWTLKGSGFTSQLMALHFPTKDLGYAVGTNGEVYKITKNKAELIYRETILYNAFHIVHFLDSLTGFTGGSNGKFFTTHDGGLSWTLKDFRSQDVVSMWAIDFYNNQIGIVSANEKLIKTTDAGLNWYVINSNTSSYDIEFINDHDLISVGNNGFIHKSSDAGETWSAKISPVSWSLKSVDFIDENNGFAVGWYGTVVKTTDSGENWTKVDIGTNETLWKIKFINNNEGYIIGYYGKIFYTSDRGITWNIQNSNTNAGLNDIFFVDDTTGYIAGEFGTLLKTLNGGIVGIAKNEELPEKFFLYQNYPNPFNPITTISYSIPSQSFVELKVYDMLGREVTILVSKEQSAGEYNIQFNASSLPSGVYVYSLKAGEYVNSRKLVLLK